MCAIGCIDQLSRNPNAIRPLANASFEDISHPEVATNLSHVDRAPLVGKTRIASDNEQAGKSGQRGYDFLDHTVGEVALPRVAAYVLKRKDSDGRPVRQRRARLARTNKSCRGGCSE